MNDKQLILPVWDEENSNIARLVEAAYPWIIANICATLIVIYLRKKPAALPQAVVIPPTGGK